MSTYTKPTTTESAIAILIQANLPFVVVGMPGVGKTEVIKAICKQIEYESQVVTVADREPVDFAGFPVTGAAKDHVKRVPAEEFYRFSEVAFGDRKGFIFFDEGNQGGQAMQAPMMRVINEGTVGDCKLGPNVARGLAINPADVGVNADDFRAPIANRLCHLDWSFSTAVWLERFMHDFPAPTVPLLKQDRLAAEITALRGTLYAFLYKQPGHILNLPTSDTARATAWPSARTWTLGMRGLAAARASNGDLDVQQAILAGFVGLGPAAEFFIYEKNLDIPDPEAIFKDPMKPKIPTRPDLVFACVMGLLATYISHQTKPRWKALMIFSARLCDETKFKDLGARIIREVYNDGLNLHNIKDSEVDAMVGSLEKHEEILTALSNAIANRGR
jgi:hypothetical protein